MPGLFAELKRRNVYKVGVTYAVVAWLIIQVVTSTFPVLELPNWATKLIVVLAVLGFPVAVILAWAFEMTPTGIQRARPSDPLQPSGRGGRAWIFVVLGAATASLAIFFLGRMTAPPVPLAAPVTHEKSIAVLPFANLSEEVDNAYFADGIQDEILARLSKIGDLKVISRTSTQKYRGKPENLRAIAQELGVANILEGSVRKVGDQVRVTVQLINALSDTHLWAETYERKLLDVFAVEREVAERIASTLEVTMTGREKAAIAQIPTQNPEAYDAYLRAIALDSSQTGERTEEAVMSFRRAVELDPDFALAWAGLAHREAFRYQVRERTEEQHDPGPGRGRTRAAAAAPVSRVARGHGLLSLLREAGLRGRPRPPRGSAGPRPGADPCHHADGTDQAPPGPSR